MLLKPNNKQVRDHCSVILEKQICSRLRSRLVIKGARHSDLSIHFKP